MAEYIERDALINILKAKEDAAPLPHKSAYRSALTTVHMLPAAGVAPVRHGSWFDRGSLSCRCSECGCKNNQDSKWCPHCGARMDERC